MLFGNENDRITDSFNVNFSSRHLKVFGQYHDLMSAIGAEFGGIRDLNSLFTYVNVQGFRLLIAPTAVASSLSIAHI
jgi:hypothetical protein